MKTWRVARILCLAMLGMSLGTAWAAGQGPVPQSLDVDEAVRIALRQNHLYRQAEAGVAAAEGARLQGFAGLLPTFGGSYAYSEDNSTTTLKDLDLQVLKPSAQNPFPRVLRRGDLALDSDRKRDTFGVNLQENLSLPLWYRYKSSRADVEGARYGLLASAQDLAFSVRQEFYLVLRAQDLLTVQKEDLRLARDQEKRIESMYELGSVARVDVLKAKVRVADAELALIQQKNQVAIEKGRLATLLGFPPATSLHLEGALKTGAVPVDSLRAAQEAMHRPDLEQARAGLRSATHLARAAALSRFPSLFATFDWNTSGGSSKGDQITQLAVPDVPEPGDTTMALVKFPVNSDSDYDGWTFRVGASVNLDAFLNLGQHKRARAAQKQAKHRLADQELTVQRELEEALLNYRASIRGIEAAQRGVESAEEDLRLSRERYEQGLGTVLELLEAQVNLTRARNNLVNAQTSLKIAEAQVDKARGAPLPQ